MAAEASAATAVSHKKKQAKEHQKAAGRQDGDRKEEHAEEQKDTERGQRQALSQTRSKKETENVDKS